MAVEQFNDFDSYSAIFQTSINFSILLLHVSRNLCRFHRNETCCGSCFELHSQDEEHFNANFMSQMLININHNKKYLRLRFRDKTHSEGLVRCFEAKNYSQEIAKINIETVTHNLSVSNGIFLGIDDNPRCEQSTVWPLQVQRRGHLGVKTSPPLVLLLPPFTLRLDP